MEPKGILRNKDETEPYHSNSDELDRKEVIRNTQLNSHMNNETSKGDKIRAQINQAKREQGLDVDDKHAKWDEISLYKNEQERSATMKIDEPKTPYEGGFDPNGEYYQEDEIPNFELGEGAQVNYENAQSLEGGEVLKNEDDDDEEEEEEEPKKPLTAEERHQLFEQKRKQHYHMKADALHHKIQIDDEDDE